MSLRIGDEAPNFTAETTRARSTSTSGSATAGRSCSRTRRTSRPCARPSSATWRKLEPEFEKRNTQGDRPQHRPGDDHERWAKDIEETQGTAPNYPIIGDADLKVAKLYDMIHPNATGGKRTAADNATIRSVFVVGPDKKVKLTLTYPMSTGRNFDEVLRVLDSIQLTAKHKVATPGELEAGRGRDHRRLGLRRRGEAEVPGGLEGAEAVPADRPPAEVAECGVPCLSACWRVSAWPGGAPLGPRPAPEAEPEGLKGPGDLPRLELKEPAPMRDGGGAEAPPEPRRGREDALARIDALMADLGLDPDRNALLSCGKSGVPSTNVAAGPPADQRQRRLGAGELKQLEQAVGACRDAALAAHGTARPPRARRRFRLRRVGLPSTVSRNHSTRTSARVAASGNSGIAQGVPGRPKDDKEKKREEERLNRFEPVGVLQDSMPKGNAVPAGTGLPPGGDMFLDAKKKGHRRWREHPRAPHPLRRPPPPPATTLAELPRPRVSRSGSTRDVERHRDVVPLPLPLRRRRKGARRPASSSDSAWEMFKESCEQSDWKAYPCVDFLRKVNGCVDMTLIESRSRRRPHLPDLGAGRCPDQVQVGLGGTSAGGRSGS